MNRAAWVLLGVLTLAGPDSRADGPGQDKAKGAAPSVVVTAASDAAFPDITVDFEVRRPDGTFLLDAGRDDFELTEDGRPVTLTKFLSPMGEPRPITVALVVDRSTSMNRDGRIDVLKAAVGTFLSGLPKGSRVSVIAFGSDVDQLCPFTDDLARVKATVDELEANGATRFYDAVGEALGLIASETGRRAVLALTDGKDTDSRLKPRSVVAAAQRLGLPVHTLALGPEEGVESEELRRLATATRGQFYPAAESDQLRAIYRELAERLRSSYTAVYRTDRRLPDGTLRPVRVAYRKGDTTAVGETALFIPGMVVPAAGWPRLFVALLACLLALAAVPRSLGRRAVSKPTA